MAISNRVGVLYVSTIRTFLEYKELPTTSNDFQDDLLHSRNLGLSACEAACLQSLGMSKAYLPMAGHGQGLPPAHVYGPSAFHPELQKVLAKQICRRKLPVLNRGLTVGAAVMVSWIVTLYAIIVGVWWPQLQEYFVDRSLAGGIQNGGNRLAAIALTGHLCDVTMGMALVPISRHSALASFFQLSVSTTLTLHMLSAYTLFVLVLIHTFLYVSWVAFINGLSANARKVLPVLNPTYLFHETWPGNTTSLGVWRASLVFTGLFAVIVMIVISVTTLPKVRRKHFNLFYFTHLFSIVMVVVICLHASTMLYCTAPGLAMWCLDWSMRLHELKSLLYGEISTFGNGWYCITVPIPRSRLAGCSCRSPLAHFFIHHGDSSTREVHPFTTITHLATKDATTPIEDGEILIQFLFRKVVTGTPERENVIHRPWLSTLYSRLRREPAKTAQWTEKITCSLDHEIDQRNHICLEKNEQITHTSVDLALRLEGPYFSPADPSRYHTVVCLVAGTGISGAIAIAGAFNTLQTSPSTAASIISQSSSSEPVWRRCIVVWSVREKDHIDLRPLMPTSDVELQVCLTGPGKPRQDITAMLSGITQNMPPKARTWAYISGPKGFIEAAKRGCKAAPKVEYHAASWEI
ncbi:MAG: hypothetical protein Q9221_006679 [Calogaya cf. arnoldii]